MNVYVNIYIYICVCGNKTDLDFVMVFIQSGMFSTGAEVSVMSKTYYFVISVM